MSPITFVAPYYYNTFWYFALLILTWAIVIYYIGSGEQKLLRSDGHDASQGFAVLLTFVIIYYVGLRPIYRDFVDMKMYAESYRLFANTYDYQWPSLRSEWLWIDMFAYFRKHDFSVHTFFLFVELIYVMGMLIGASLVTRNNLLMTMMFMITSFSFLSFGENGIRNGMSCSILLVAICLLPREEKRHKALAVLLMILAMGVHRSSMLPIMTSVASLFAIKNTKTAMRFWIASFGISLVAGPLMEQFFASLGFDDRMEQYTSVDDATMESTFSKTGFRWDFLLYSAFPIIMIWYVTIYRKFRDKTYNVIAITYILCNAFWLMVIRAAYSNRFAYLSWFIYPLVIAYPLLRMNLWKDQDRRTAIILFFYSLFEFFMFFVYYFGTTGFKGFQLYWWRRGG